MPELPTDVSSASIPALYSMQAEFAKQVADARSRLGAVTAELFTRFAASVKATLDQAGKTHGSATLPLQDGFALKTDTKQTVKWDSAQLQAIATTLPWERVVALFKIDFSMSETIYKGVAALSPELREKIDAARTTKIGEPVITLTKEA